jgi:hypothetical protein
MYLYEHMDGYTPAMNVNTVYLVHEYTRVVANHSFQREY